MIQIRNMDRDTRAQFRAQAEILKVLAHPRRMFILEALAHEDLDAASLAQKAGTDLNSILPHLEALQSILAVKGEVSDGRVIYRLQCACILNFLRCMQTVQAAVNAQPNACGTESAEPHNTAC
jgi:ArsR family transcriptional regulator, arsenate/arsenite/antimonite-responsive transcriptional repressor